MKKLLFMASLVLAGCNAPEPATLVVKTDPNSEVVDWGAGKDEIKGFSRAGEGEARRQLRINRRKHIC